MGSKVLLRRLTSWIQNQVSTTDDGRGDLSRLERLEGHIQAGQR